MYTFKRRNLLSIGLGTAISPLFAGSTGPSSTATSVGSFSDGNMKGFVLGTVRNRDAAYFDAVAKTGTKFGRIFFPFTKCRDCDQYGQDYEHVESLKRILDLARDRDIKLVLVGEFPGSEKAEFWSNAALRTSFVENWRLFAKTFGKDPVIVGLDLLNEPNPPWTNGKLAGAQALWRSLAEITIEAIRSETVILPIIFEGVAGGSSLGLRGLEPLTDSQVVYSIHFYTPHDITHQHVNSTWKRTIPYPAGLEYELGKWDTEIGVTAWNRQRLEIDLRDTVTFQKKYKVPIYVGEFSCVRWAPNNSREKYISDCLAIFKKYGWSWTYHEFRGWPGWDAEIISEDRAETKRSSNAPVINMLLNELRIRKN